jgi:hypothetical protein
MKTSPPVKLSSRSAYAIRIECAVDCDGSKCHQPLFKGEGALDPIFLHHHLVEILAGAPVYFAICGLAGSELALG